MLKTKVKSACFVRAISELIKKDCLNIVGSNYNYKIFVIHLGIHIPEKLQLYKNNSEKNFYKIACIANLDIIKGHKYLISACKILEDKEFKFECFFIGDGKERKNLEKQLFQHNINNIQFKGFLPHEEVIQLLKNREFDLIVLPSITIPPYRAEGIPISLLEAIAYQIPVISTNTGAIPELVDSNALVPEKDSNALANKIIEILSNDNIQEIVDSSYSFISREYNINKTSKLLSNLIIINIKND